jgi:chemotaxis family two-component system response regulator Rcp1
MNEEIKLINVLLVDDDPEDIDLTLEVMEMAKMKLNVTVAKDGMEAMEILSELKENKEEMPDLILLDLNMPRKNGHEVLADLKADDLFKKIPVVILTTSKSEADVNQSYSKGVSCYITKPVGLNEFRDVVDAIKNFWFTVVKYPTKD